MFMRTLFRPRAFQISALTVVAICALSFQEGRAQQIKNMDGSLSVIGTFTNSTSGNGLTDNPSRTIGALGQFRQAFRPWLGYEVNYSYARYAEFFSNLPFSVQNNVHEVTVAYFVHAPMILGMQPFAAAGLGALIFLPTTTGGQYYPKQTRVPLFYEFGLNHPLFTSHFGVRVQLRGLEYKTPNFGSQRITINARRETIEPSVGVYVHF